MDALGDGLGTRLAVACRLEAFLGNAVLDEVVHNTLGTTLRETLVIFLAADTVGV